MTDIKNLKDEFQNIYDEYKKKFQAAIDELIQQVFDEIPMLGGLAWDQYTPYFNDGDPCVFHVHDLYAYRKEALDDEEYSDYSCACSLFEDELSKYVLEKPSKWVFEGAEKHPEDNYYKDKVDAWNSLSESEREQLDKLDDFKDAMRSIPDEFFDDAYGDHVTIRINRIEGGDIETSIEDYTDHE